MKLLRCHIANYGCLHDFSFKFADGINLIEQPNGWGKSTFASFLCAMLYGLEFTTRRSLLENERKHYRPWDGGNFGGWLEFEVSGRQYRMERFFGQKEREDTFILYDLKTMQISHDYTEKAGFELFGIDKAGYLRSIYVPQGRTSSGYNDTLAARLARLTQSADDINAYEESLEKIDKALRFYVKTGKRGEIARLEQETSSIEQQLFEAQTARNQLAENTSRLSLLNLEKEQLSQQLATVKEEIAASTRQEIQAHHALLQQQLAQKEQELESIEDFFHDQLPEEDEINSYLLLCTQLSHTEQEQRIKAFTSDQTQDFCFLQNFFNSLQTSCCAADAESDFSSETAIEKSTSVFTCTQKELLLNSPRYHSEAVLLFPSEQDQDQISYEFSSDKTPTPEMIQQARKLYHEYCGYLTAQDETEKFTASIHEQANSVQKQIILIQNQIDSGQKQVVSGQEQVNSGQKQEFPHFLFSPSFSWLSVSIVLVIISIILGSAFKPIVGLLFGFISESVCTLGFLYFRTLKSTFHTPAQEDLPQRQFDRELQFQLSQLEVQLSQLQAQSDLALNRKNELYESQKFCLEHLHIISEQLHLSVNLSEPLTDNFLPLLFQLEQQLKNKREFLLKQQQLCKKQQIFYNQLRKNYNQYLMEQKHQKHLEKTIFNLRQDIFQYLQMYFEISGEESVTEFDQKLNYLKLQLSTYKKLLTDMRQASQNLNTFLQEHPSFQDYTFAESEKTEVSENAMKFEASETSHKEFIASKSVSQLQKEESSFHEQYSNCIQQISFLLSQNQQLQTLAENAPSLEEKKELLHQQITRYTNHYRILSLTKQYLIKARHDFTNSYLHSIEQHFHHYANILEKDDLVDADINSDFRILLSSQGVLREPEWFSQGTRDLMDLCLRLSIIEDLFSDEQPFLILDDPFVNLDNFSLKKISSLLHDIESKWQILYFTCHSSRNIKNL